MSVERISAITIKVDDMARSVHFYSKLLGLKVLYGGESDYFSSLQTLGTKDAILNLEKGHVTPAWGRIIFRVEDVDRFWDHMKEKNSVLRDPEMQYGVRSTSIYSIQTATNCHLPNRSAKTSRFIHYLDECRNPSAKK